MAGPYIVNRTPAIAAEGVNPGDPLLVSVRDVETRVVLENMLIGEMFSRSIFSPADEDLPFNSGLTTEMCRFNDALPLVSSGETADQEIDEGIYRITRQTETDASFLAIHDTPSGDVAGASAVIALEPGMYTRGATAYYDNEDFTGAMFGLVHWEYGTAVFLFFTDDNLGNADSRKIVIAGPAQDEAGTRTILATVDHEWSADTFSYVIYMNTDPARRRLVVLVEGDSQEVLYDGAPDFDQLDTNFRLGNTRLSDDPVYVTAIVGIDNWTLGDAPYIDIGDVGPYSYGNTLLLGAAQTGASEVSVASSEMQVLEGTEGTELAWEVEGTGSLGTNLAEEAIVLSREDGDGEDTYLVSREAPELQSQKWMVLLDFALDGSEHVGSYNTGVGVDVSDGTYIHRLRLLDLFDEETYYLGLYEWSASASLDSDSFYQKAVVEDLSTSKFCILLGDAAADTLDLFLDDEDEIPVATGTYSDSEAEVSEGSLRVGFVDDHTEFFGSTYLWRVWFLALLDSYEARGLAVPAGDWTACTGGGVVPLIVTEGLYSHLEIDATVAEDAYYWYCIYDEDYDHTSGAAVHFKMQVEEWSLGGSTNPTETAIGPLVMVRLSGGKALQLFFAQDRTGVNYLVFPHTEDDVLDIIRGTASNAESKRVVLPDLEKHSYFLRVCYRQHVRLYVDYEDTPSIDLDWATYFDSMDMVEPEGMGDFTVAFGAKNAKMNFSFVRPAIGRGYDFSVLRQATESILSNYIYGSAGQMIIVAEDLD